ncbi:SUMF1/EgtB/PvdO family nonheme iron enzyme [Paenibacillus xylanexedens]|uniref:SUMF1/EgtB/PvdO family nonheme iron enzyme n=1 Tax=Paenibacillus xylanexedens TaxID=528191 RepID=UPI00119DF6E7|nr:SUMF1/EgtB/PvdO family nonheme iron enzyme [Paenibacillus xylanexedens]
MVYVSEIDSKEKYQNDLQLLIEVENQLEPDNVESLSSRELNELMDFILIKLRDIEHPVAAEDVFGMTLGHPNSFVRSKLIDFVKEWLPYHSAVETMIRLITDPDDLVSFKAIEISGSERLQPAAGKLLNIIGSLSKSIENPGKPVGFGANIVIKSLFELFGTEDVQEIKLIEEYYNKHGLVFNADDFAESIPQEIVENFERQKEEGMILIPGGFFEFGINPEDVPDQTFDWSDASPKQKVWLPPFFIDKYPVTNEKYDLFVEDIKENGHIFCHTFEPSEKEHKRNTYYDSRFYDASLPVTGIDFYDAYAYSRWAGKELPTEFQWEKAAKGEGNLIFPWGNTFNSAACNSAYSLLGVEEINDLTQWRDGLWKAYREDEAQRLVKSAKEYEQFASSYGVVGMTGNHWEWTRSELMTKRAFIPAFEQKEKRLQSMAVLKGGSFTSLPGLMFSAFRGKDIPFCRHNEMGIRCVKNIPIQVIRKALKQPIRNTAIY